MKHIGDYMKTLEEVVNEMMFETKEDAERILHATFPDYHLDMTIDNTTIVKKVS